MGIKLSIRRAALFSLAVVALSVVAQEPPPETKRNLSPQARLAAAKTVYMRNAGGSDIPFNVIQAGIESWPRYTIVNSPEKADLTIELLSPEQSANTSSSKGKVEGKSRGGQQSPTESLPAIDAVRTMKLTVSDAKTKLALFTATQTPKDAWNDKARTESQIQCAQKLLTLFRNRVEPPEPAAPETSSK